jgi:hypothetical protein
VAKPSLREPFATLASDLIETMTGGLHEWRPDLDYPQSHSDWQGCIRAVLRKYDVKLRAVPRDTAEILEPPDTCPICREPFGDSGETVTTIQRFDETRSTYAHLKCVNREQTRAR